MDRVAQRISMVPCGILAACVVSELKITGMLDWLPVKETSSFRSLWVLCALAFFLHVVVHNIVLDCLKNTWIPPDSETKVPYSEAAKHFPANWFTVNPVHCLRSKYVHGHKPYCMVYIHGKDHLLEKNTKIGLYYEAKKFDDTNVSPVFARQSSLSGSRLMRLLPRSATGMVADVDVEGDEKGKEGAPAASEQDKGRGSLSSIAEDHAEEGKKN